MMAEETVFDGDGDEEKDPWADYESGPFCRCWGELGFCENTCKRCGHFCKLHFPESCEVEGCDCPAWESGE